VPFSGEFRVINEEIPDRQVDYFAPLFNPDLEHVVID